MNKPRFNNKRKTMTEQRNIHWEKWRDPFGSDIEPHEMPKMPQDPMEAMREELDGVDIDFDEMEEMANDQERVIPSIPAQPMNVGMISTPNGIIPVTEFTNTSQRFNFWVLHTNFDIQESDLKLINEAVGVETLEPVTRYQARIAVGKLFNSQEVKVNVMKNLQAISKK